MQTTVYGPSSDPKSPFQVAAVQSAALRSDCFPFEETMIPIVQQGPSPEEDYGLDAVAKHNATHLPADSPLYDAETRGLGIYVSQICLLGNDLY